MNKWSYIAYGCAWIATGITVSIAVYITKSASPVWAMLIPSFISMSSKRSDDKDKTINE